MENFWKRFELKNFIDKQLEQYGILDAYNGGGVSDDCRSLLYAIEDHILDKVEELYV